MRSRLLAISAAAAVCASPAPAARAAWSQPLTISSPHAVDGELTVAAGTAASSAIGDMVAWKYNDLRSAGIFGQTLASYAFAVPQASFGPERALPASYASGPLVNFGGGRVGQLIYGHGKGSKQTLKVALGWVDGSFAVSQQVTASVYGHSASLAGDLAGCAVVAWVSSPRFGHRQVWASVRPPNGRFGAPQLLSATANGFGVTAAAGPPAHRNPVPCDIAVAFDSKKGRMLVRVRPHDRGWGRVEDIGPAAVGTQNAVAAYIGRDGRVTVAWCHQQLSEGGPLGPAFTQVAVEPPGLHNFQRAQTLERDPVGVSTLFGARPVIESVDGRGRLIAFLAQPGPASAPPFARPPVVRVSYGKGTSYEPPLTISAAGEQASSLSGAEGPFGVILAWVGTPTPQQPTRAGPLAAVFAAETPPLETRIGGVEQVSPYEVIGSAVAGASVLGPPWIVAWAGQSSASRSVVRVAGGS